MSTSLFEKPANPFSAPASDYLNRLKRQSQRYMAPSVGNKPATATIKPNEQFTVQQAANNGVLVAPEQDIFAGIDEREDEIVKRGDIATETEQAKLDQRRRESARNMAGSIDSAGSEFGSELGEFTGDGSGSGLDDEQMKYARLIADVGRKRGLGENEIQIALMTALTESGLRNLNYGDRDSVGLFQQRTSQGWGSVGQIMDPTYSANKFYEALSKSARGANPWNTAQNVQRSFDPTGSNFAKQWGLAQQAYRALSGGNSANAAAIASNNPGLSSWINAHNNRYLDYDNAYGAQCVDMYSYYTTGFVGGKPLPVGYAPEIYNNYDRNVYNRLGNNITARMGDVAIWNPNPRGATPLGHVAIVVGDNGNGTLRVLHSNATSAGSRGNSVISNISKSALAGYLRPKRLG